MSPGSLLGKCSQADGSNWSLAAVGMGQNVGGGFFHQHTRLASPENVTW